MNASSIDAKLRGWIEPGDSQGMPNSTGRKTPGPGSRRIWISATLGLLGIAWTFLAAAQQPFTDLEVKAVFLYNFSSFVNWPQVPGQDPAKPFHYCILDDEMAPVLLKALKDEKVGGRSLRVQQEVTTANLIECQVLYVGKSRMRGSETWNLVREAPAAHILTVSDLEGFETQGGMIALVRQGRRIHPRINIDVVEKSQLRISAKLLNLATIVRDSTPGH